MLNRERCEEQKLEAENMLEKQRSSVNELRRKVNDLTVRADEAEALRSELEEYREAVERMASMEVALQKYERDAQERVELEDQIKALEQQNTDLLKRSQEAEDEYRKLLRFKTIMGSFEEQVKQLASSNRELLEEKGRLEEELHQLTETCTYLEEDRDRNVEHVQLLEEQIKELELGGGTPIEKAINHRASVVIDETIETDMEENMKKANITELRMNIQRLKSQIKEMEKKQATSDNSQRPENDSESSKARLKKDYASIVAERDQLRKELEQIRNGIPDSLLNQAQTIMAFRSRMLDLEKESSYLKESTISLEATVLQGTSNIAKGVVSLQGYEEEHSRLQDRLNRLEDITKMQLHDINRMLVEANYLHGINVDGAPKDRPQLTSEELETIKEQNTSLQICVLNLQEEINESQSRIRKVRDLIKLYSQLLEEMTTRFSGINQPKDQPTLLNRTPRTKEEEHDLLKKQIHNVRAQSRREQQLIISAWYDLARRNHRDTASLSIRSTPSSWLGQQRKILDNQLRKRLC